MTNQKNALVLGSGFIGTHMVNRLKSEGYWVRCVDLEYPPFSATTADHFVIRDLRDAREVRELVGYAGCNRNPHETFAKQFDKSFDEIYLFASLMGGAGFIFTGENDADIMHDSTSIVLNVLNALKERNDHHKTKIFFSSSACVYPEYNQLDPDNPKCSEDSAYPAAPDSAYGSAKLFAEEIFDAYHRNYGFHVRIGRFHNIYGPLGTWQGGKEKAPAAICRKIAQAKNGGEIEIWGDGKQTRSFLYIDDCIDAVRELMESNFMGPVNIGSEEMVAINELVHTVSVVARKPVTIKHIDGPQGVRGRNSDNVLIYQKLGWVPKHSLRAGLSKTFEWIEDQVHA